MANNVSATQAPRSLLTLTGSQATHAWRAGQVLKAIALAPTVDGKVPLRIGDTTVQAQTQLSVTTGQTLELQVQRLGQPVVLKVLPPPTAPDPAKTALRANLPRQSGLPPLLANLAAAASQKTPLPAPVVTLAKAAFSRISDNQSVRTGEGLRRALDNSGLFLESKLARQATQDSPINLANDFKAALLRLRQGLLTTPREAAPQQPPAESGDTNKPPPAQVSQQVRQAIPNTRPESTPSPREQTAVQSQTAPTAPDKAAQAATAYTATPRSQPGGPDIAAHGRYQPPLRGGAPQPQAPSTPSLGLQFLESGAREELLRQVEGALARIQLSQLASTPGDEAGSRPSWLLELPLRHETGTDLLQLRIQRDASEPGKSTASGNDVWSAVLAFEFPGLGPVHVRVMLTGETVSTRFWAERAETAHLVQTHLSHLGDSLNRAGLEIGGLHCHTGSPPEPASPSHGAGLVEEKA